MRKLLTLRKDYEIKLKSRITHYLDPEYIFIPYENNENIISKIDVKKEEKITEKIITPVSGKITGTRYCLTVDKGLTKCLSISNDYKETFLKRNASIKNLEKISFEKIIIDLQNYHYYSLAEKLKTAEKKSILILNGIEDEPYVANEIFINKEYKSDILEILDIIREKIEASKTIVALKNNDRENIEGMEDFLGTYPKIDIQLVPDYYLIGKEKYLKEYLNITTDCLLLKPSEIRTICSVIKRRRYITEKIITISGNAITNPQIIETKIGSSVKDIIEKYIHCKKNVKLDYWINGIMSGKKMDIENLIVTEELNAILIMIKDDLEEKECINCGKCVQICPAFCNPKEAYQKRKAKYAKDCLDCGLCSYICPSFINLRQYVKGDNNE